MDGTPAQSQDFGEAVSVSLPPHSEGEGHAVESANEYAEILNKLDLLIALQTKED